MFKLATSSNYFKVLTLATISVCTWLLYIIPDKSSYHIAGIELWSSRNMADPPDFLPLEIAKAYCRARRWEAYPHRQSRRKIYDLVLINNELEWLEIRMGQIAEQVDYFVIVEAAKTFTDVDKPLHVRENLARFKKYHDKMILHTLDMEDVELNGNWEREEFSRNAMYSQVIPKLTDEQEALLGDVIIVSDVDEIPRPDALKTLRNCELPKEVTLHTKVYYYSFQWLKSADWPHPQATIYDFENTTLPQPLRLGSSGAHLYNAGWHCSYCFSTVAELVTKIKSFSHSELNQPEFTNEDKIVHRVRNGLDMFDRANEKFLIRVEDNPDVPPFLLEHKEKYQHLLDRDPTNGNFRDYTPQEELDD